jgi:hypothetical protein
MPLAAKKGHNGRKTWVKKGTESAFHVLSWLSAAMRPGVQYMVLDLRV